MPGIRFVQTGCAQTRPANEKADRHSGMKQLGLSEQREERRPCGSVREPTGLGSPSHDVAAIAHFCPESGAECYNRLR